MSELKKWAQGKNPVVALFAIQAAMQAEIFSRVLVAAKKPSVLVPLGKVSLIPLNDWLSFYTNRARYLLPLFKTLKFKPDFESALSDEAEAQKNLDRLFTSQLNIESVSDSLCQSLSSDEDPFASLDTNDPQLLRSLIFLILVALPSYFFYLKQPGQLFREARQGHVKSLEMLLRLDSSTIFDPIIAKRLHELRFTRPAVFERLISSSVKPPKKKTSRQKLKASLAAGISTIAHYYKSPLTEPEIRALFDAVAHTLSQGETDIDADLPESAEAFAKAIQREVPGWKSIIKPDKK